MKVGFISIFSYRPFVKHLTYLAKILSEAGHETSFLVCDSSVDKCYSQFLKGHSKLRECPVCILGGFRSFPLENIYSINPNVKVDLDEKILQDIASSSSYTIHRVETKEDCQNTKVLETQKALYQPIEIVYGNVIEWAIKNKLDSIICFNGRMDLTKAAIYACENIGVPYITVERPWFANGLHLTPNGNCLSLKEFNRFNFEYRNKPLTLKQAQYAAHLMSIRFLHKNQLDWRIFQFENSTSSKNLIASSGQCPRVIILPSSSCEFIGHPDWKSDWDHFTDALDELIAVLGITYKQCILRGHPIWSENIGCRTGEKSQKHYYEWANARGVRYINSKEKVNTYLLMKEADIIIVANSSSGVEAGILGKKVISLGKSRYQNAGFVTSIKSRNDWFKLENLENHDPLSVIRLTLRYVYMHSCRITQYVNYIRFISSGNYEYYGGADPEQLLSIFRIGQLKADDPLFAQDTNDEDKIISDLFNQNWQKFSQWEFNHTSSPTSIDRKMGLRWVDSVRNLFPRGDR
ncbi:hypothetical protein PN462_07640 [Spirulina sp. CS-785/01]|uniref:capsular polysaccharide export protein, LipB/KpsS family n=1 Tax=Spirulina sp. CS-785/01 TaxID=3021716 RepID=UPI00232AD1DE|nr:hypothetical protein [Spirulina sp. CS-785/01]MDB9312969.1 hypothetical protein [Spirulina sp. CS-785/01]